MYYKKYIYEELQSQEYSRFLWIKRKYLIPETRPTVNEWTYELLHIKRSEAPLFEAISYAWGSAEKNHVLELADGREISTTASVFTALRRLAAHSQTSYLWIGQIYINQDDAQEWSAQVQIMGDVYMRADRVLAWLGKLNSTDSVFLKELLHAVEEERGGVAPHWLDRENPRMISRISGILSIHTGLDMHLNALINFLDVPRFRRGWIFREAVLCKSLVLLIDDIETKGIGILDSLITAISGVEEKVEEFNRFSQGPGYRAALGLCNESHQRYTGAMWPRKRTFVEFLSETAGKEVTDPRDHVYGFLGFETDPSIEILPDYDLSTEFAFTETTKAILVGTSSLDALSAIREPRIPSPECEEDELPSWVPDWSLPRQVYPFCKTAHGAYSPLFDASAGRAFKPTRSFLSTFTPQLTIRGREIAEIAYVTDHPLPAEGAMRPEVIKRRLSLGLNNSLLIEDCRLDLQISTKRLIKVLLADGAVGSYMPSKSEHPLDSTEIDSLLEVYRLLCRTVFPLKYNDNSNVTYVDLDYGVEVLFGMSQATLNRRLFCTSRCDLGLGPATAIVGDRVIIAHGSRTPLVVRPCGPGKRYRLVGECYLEYVNVWRGLHMGRR